MSTPAPAAPPAPTALIDAVPTSAAPEWRLDGAGALDLRTPAVSLCAGTPVINGAPLAAARLVQHDPPIWEGADGVRFGLEFTPAPAALEGDSLCLRWWVEGVAPAALDSFGLRFGSVQNARRMLRSGYFSWDGSRYLDLDGPAASEAQAGPLTGYALVQLLPRTGSGCLVAGFDRHDRFQQSFTLDATAGVPTLTLLTLWDRKQLPGGAKGVPARCTSEKLLVFTAPQAEEGLRRWARAVAQAAPISPRTGAPPITGWCSWYNLYAAITPENLRHHLRTTAQVAQREGLPLSVFLIDDGFTPEMGDWLELKPAFAQGIAPLLQEVRAAGFVPGLWIAPFVVGNRSRLYAEHPDWVVHDAQTGEPIAHMRFYGEFRWHKRSEEYYILDATHPDAFAYLRRVFRTWRREWGCAYYKTDFLQFGSEYGPERARSHTPGRTRIETWRAVMEMIREEIGDALWLGCGTPLWAPVGLMDAVRIGRDIGAEWSGTGAQSVLRDGANRNFANGILWQADPDCLLLRGRFHMLEPAAQQALITYACMTGGLITTSDDLAEVPAPHLAILRLFLHAAPGACRYPLLGSDDPVLVQVRALDATTTALFVFNTADQAAQRTWPLAALGLAGRWQVAAWAPNAPPTPLHAHTNQLALTLPPRSGRLLLLTPAAAPV